MSQMIFDEKSLLDGNIFKYEQRLQSHLNKYIENGAILTRYYSLDENRSTVDRGLKTIDELFGNHAPLRYNQIEDFPIYGFGQANPENSDEQQIEDINVDGECVILPSTIVPHPNDFFILKHLKMDALFQVTNVEYDSMKVNGYYRIKYHLISTSRETIQSLEQKIVGVYHTDLNLIGSESNPIIKEDDFVLRGRIQQMVGQMIKSYIALFYSRKHNCFLYHNPETGLDWFDMCGNEFISKHGLMNNENSPTVLMLNDKINDVQLPLRYHDSIYNWLEMGAPVRLLQKFFFTLSEANAYPYSSFVRTGDGETLVMYPLSVNDAGVLARDYSYFDEVQFETFMNENVEPLNEYEKLIWKYIHKDNISIEDISLYTADALISSVKHISIFLYTPMIIYIIREVLRLK